MTVGGDTILFSKMATYYLLYMKDNGFYLFCEFIISLEKMFNFVIIFDILHSVTDLDFQEKISSEFF